MKTNNFNCFCCDWTNENTPDS